MFENVKNDRVFKTVTTVVLTIAALGIVLVIFNELFVSSRMYGMNSHNMTGVIASGVGLYGILAGLLKVLLFVSIVGFVAGMFMFARHNYFSKIAEKPETLKATGKSTLDCPKCSAKVADGFVFCTNCGEKLKTQCASCNVELKAEWKCCPYCGAEKP